MNCPDASERLTRRCVTLACEMAGLGMSSLGILTIAFAVSSCGRSKSGSGDEAKIDDVVADALTYSSELPAVLLAFDGNCDQHADRLLALEPLARSIRERISALVHDDPANDNPIHAQLAALVYDDPKSEAKLGPRSRARKTELKAKVDAYLAASKRTVGDMQIKQADIQRRCADVRRVKDAVRRTSLLETYAD